MIERKISVPNYVDFISNWVEFENEIPHGKVLLNKKYPGCGMTTYYLTNQDPIILCAPRKLLLSNKKEQLEDINKDCYLYSLPEKSKKPKEGELTPVQKNYNELVNYINSCINTGIAPKILVTYDSLHHVLQATNSLGYNFKIVVDEAHVIFSDTEMKPERTESFCQLLSVYPSEIVYLSATPDRDDFGKVPYFQDLIYTELEWPKDKIQENLIHYVPIRSTIKEACNIVNNYKINGYFQVKGNQKSTEVVFFLNDVSKICKIIIDCNLSPSEVNIIVSDMSADKVKEKLGSSYSIGKPPKKGKPHKTYTFCSKTAFMGCDFYSTNAYSYIFADANLKNMTTDIALDLPQILGRQRLDCNIFKNEATVFVNLNSGKLESQAEFDQMREAKSKFSEGLKNKLSSWTTIELNSIVGLKQKESYVVIKENYLTGEKEAIVSEMRKTAEERAWVLRHKIYKDHETVMSLITNNDMNITSNGYMSNEVRQFYLWFVEQKDTRLKLQGYVEFLDMYPQFMEQVQSLCTLIPQDYHELYNTLGPSRIKGYGYQISKLKELMIPTNNIRSLILSNFNVGDKYLNKDLKFKLQEIYDSLNLKKTAKASDILEYFNCKSSIFTENGVRTHGLKILSVK